MRCQLKEIYRYTIQYVNNYNDFGKNKLFFKLSFSKSEAQEIFLGHMMTLQST